MIQSRQYQDDAVAWLSRRKRGIVVAAAGSGKTIIAALSILKVVERKTRALQVRIGWVCNTQEQKAQAYSAMFTVFTGEAPDNIWEAESRWNTYQPVAPIDFVAACAAANTDWDGYDLLVVDENHHSDAPSWRKQIETCQGARWGFTATPPEDQDELHRLKEMFGGCLYEIPREDVSKSLSKAKVIIIEASDKGVHQKIDALAQKIYQHRTKWAVVGLNLRITGNSFAHKEEIKNMGCVWSQATTAWYAPNEIIYRKGLELCGGKLPAQIPSPASQNPQTKGEVFSRALWEACVKEGIVNNVSRNQAAVTAANEAIKNGRHVLLLVNLVTHGQELVKQIPGSVLCNSKMGKRKREDAIEDFKTGKIPCLVATSLADEGLDIPVADTLIPLSGGRSRGKADQRSGRVMRQFAGKTHALIYHFQDATVHPLMEKHANIRLLLYCELGYGIGNNEI